MYFICPSSQRFHITVTRHLKNKIKKNNSKCLQNSALVTEYIQGVVDGIKDKDSNPEFEYIRRHKQHMGVSHPAAKRQLV